ncbi:MAG TPA: folate-binding protein [Methylocella sp.]|nr:folate-binding protein [Methylocella sp.]
MSGEVCVLKDRGVIRLEGADTAGFLQRLITNSVLDIAGGEARYSALLSPQGKLLFDFFVVPLPKSAGAGFLFDCVKVQAGDLVKRLNLHKMRARIAIDDLSERLGVAAVLAGNPPEIAESISYSDPRTAGMGLRLIAPREALAQLPDAGEAVYEAHRVSHGVPEGGIDFSYGDAFVHDANIDWLNGVDFKKGCYVGQEVVARVHFRNSARKRIVKVHFEGAAPPSSGTPVMAGAVSLGPIGSVAGADGLAMLRLDRLEEARAAGAELRAGEAVVTVELPAESAQAAVGVEKQH